MSFLRELGSVLLELLKLLGTMLVEPYRALSPAWRAYRRERPVSPEHCGCERYRNNDVLCHVCGSWVYKICPICETPRGAGVCPNPRMPDWIVSFVKPRYRRERLDRLQRAAREAEKSRTYYERYASPQQIRRIK